MYYRATPNDSAPDGKSPAELMLGRKMRLPLNALLPPGPVEQEQRNRKMERQFNAKHGAKSREFRPNQEVKVRLSSQHEWTSGVVLECLGKVTYMVLCNDTIKRLHANQLRAIPAVPDELYDTPQPPPQEETEKARKAPRRNPRAVSRSSPPLLRPRPRRN